MVLQDHPGRGVWFLAPGHKQEGDYRGLRYGRERIAKEVEKLCPGGGCTYVEPFAGHAWVFRELIRRGVLKPRQVVLGDKVCTVFDFVKYVHRQDVEQSDPSMRCQDYRRTIIQTDSNRTVFVIDPPWDHRSCESVKDYIDWSCDFSIEDVIETVKHLKGKAIITLHPSQRDILCHAPFKCKQFERQVGNDRMKYLMGIKE